jgi:hypothetical protein
MNTLMKYRILIFAIVIFSGCELKAQITPNKVDSLGLKQGMWKEFKIPYNMLTEDISFKVPEINTDYYILTKDKHRKYFPILECIGEYRNGLKTGIWIEYDGDGRINRQNEYKEGVPFGHCKMFWPTGILKMEYTINSCDSILVKAYDENGDLFIEKLNSKIDMIRSIYQN